MSDYSNHDRHRSQRPDYYDVGRGGATWVWVGIVVFALVALAVAIFAGEPVDGDGATTPALAEPAAPTAAPDASPGTLD